MSSEVRFVRGCRMPSDRSVSLPISDSCRLTRSGQCETRSSSASSVMPAMCAHQFWATSSQGGDARADWRIPKPMSECSPLKLLK